VIDFHLSELLLVDLFVWVLCLEFVEHGWYLSFMNFE